jgi:hypothetical protein
VGLGYASFQRGRHGVAGVRVRADRGQGFLVRDHDVDGGRGERPGLGVEFGLQVVVERYRAEHDHDVVTGRQVGAVQRVCPAVGVLAPVDRDQRV